MKVWAVMQAEEYVGTHLEGLYMTKELAEAALAELQALWAGSSRVDEYFVEEMEVKG